jgi:acyl-CoA reductase-like NAD-dependent aldehyde dehydrogenase
VAQEEIFGPVLVCIRYRDEEDAIAVADDSEYGLGGTVSSSDVERATRVARSVITGTIGVNGYIIDVNAPFGGVKNSGSDASSARRRSAATNSSSRSTCPLVRSQAGRL